MRNKPAFILSFFLLVALGIIGYMANEIRNIQKKSFRFETYYRAQNKEIIEKDSVQIDAIFIGNSIIYNWNNSHPQFMPNNNYLSRGIGGQTTNYLLLRFRSDVVDLKPKIVVISGGINDIGGNDGEYDPQLTLTYLQNMADIAAANGIRVIMTSVLPSNEIYWNLEIEDTAQKVIDLNKQIRKFAKEKGYVYVDYYSALVDENLGLKAEYATDPVHVNTNGYAVMEKIIKEEIDKQLEIINRDSE